METRPKFDGIVTKEFKENETEILVVNHSDIFLLEAGENKLQCARLQSLDNLVVRTIQTEIRKARLHQRLGCGGQFTAIPADTRNQLAKCMKGLELIKPEAEQSVQPATEQLVQPKAVQLVQPAAADQQLLVQAIADQTMHSKTIQQVQPKVIQLVQPEAEQLVKPEAEQTVHLEADQAAKSEAEQIDQSEADQTDQSEAEQSDQSEAEQTAQPDAEQSAQSEADQTAKSEADQTAKSEAEQQVQEELLCKLDDKYSLKISGRDATLLKIILNFWTNKSCSGDIDADADLKQIRLVNFTSWGMIIDNLPFNIDNDETESTVRGKDIIIVKLIINNWVQESGLCEVLSSPDSATDDELDNFGSSSASGKKLAKKNFYM